MLIANRMFCDRTDRKERSTESSNPSSTWTTFLNSNNCPTAQAHQNAKIKLQIEPARNNKNIFEIIKRIKFKKNYQLQLG